MKESNVISFADWKQKLLQAAMPEKPARASGSGEMTRPGPVTGTEQVLVAPSDMLRLQLWFVLTRNDEWACMWNGAMSMALKDHELWVSRSMYEQLKKVDVDRVQQFVLENF